MSSIRASLGSLVLVLLLPASTPAQVVSYWVKATGSELVPAQQTAAGVNGVVNVDLTTGAVSVDATIWSWSSPITSAALYGPARRGQVGGALILPFVVTGTQYGTCTATGVLTPAQLQTVRDGLAYVEMTSVLYPNGEARGQVDDVPGSGDTGIAQVLLGGSAVAGGRLDFGLAGNGTRFVLLGMALPPGQVIPITSDLFCRPGMPGIALDPRGPVVMLPRSGSIPIPLGIQGLVAIQGVDMFLCTAVTRGWRVAIGP